MDFDFIRSATSKELEQFKSVCNQLLSRTYIVRTLFRPGKGRVNNPDYTFLSLHYEAVQEYLSLLDWDLRKDDLSARTESMPADFAKVSPSQVLSLAEDISSGSWRTLRERSSVRAVARTAGMHFSRNSEGSLLGVPHCPPEKGCG